MNQLSEHGHYIITKRKNKRRNIKEEEHQPIR